MAIIKSHKIALALSKKTLKNVTEKQKEALKHWSGEGYKKINTVLKKKKNWLGLTIKGDAKTQEIIKDVQDAIKAAPVLKKPIITYRGINVDEKTAKNLLDYFKDKKGKEEVMSGFIASSINPVIGLNFAGLGSGIVLEIKAKKGLSLEEISETPYEAEFLLDHNTKFKVVNVIKAKYAFDDPEKGYTYKFKKDVIQLEQII